MYNVKSPWFTRIDYCELIEGLLNERDKKGLITVLILHIKKKIEGLYALDDRYHTSHIREYIKWKQGFISIDAKVY